MCTCGADDGVKLRRAVSGPVDRGGNRGSRGSQGHKAALGGGLLFIMQVSGPVF